MYPNEENFKFRYVPDVPKWILTIFRKESHMQNSEELNRKLETLHKENKDILALLFSMDKNETKSLDEIITEVDSMYDKDFYGE